MILLAESQPLWRLQDYLFLIKTDLLSMSHLIVSKMDDRIIVKRVLCTYAARQIDSNLFMAGTIFNGLKICGYAVDMVFCSPDTVYETLHLKYAKYFNMTWHLALPTSKIASLSVGSAGIFIRWLVPICQLSEID